MKLIIAAATAILSVSAFAGSISSHNYSQVLGPIALDNACVTATEVKSINPVRVCTKLEARTTGANGEIGQTTDWVCVAWDMKDLSFSRSYEKTVCLKNAPVNEGSHGECIKFGKVTDVLPATIKVTTMTSHGEADSQSSSWFTFPACN